MTTSTALRRVQLASFRTGRSALYVIEIGDDRLKVGIAANPTSRLQEHRSNAAAHGVSTGRTWVSPATAGLLAEAALLEFCAQHATAKFRREYFTGVRFENAVTCAAGLTGYSAEELWRKVYVRSPNTRYPLYDLAQLLWTTTDVVEDMVTRGLLGNPDHAPWGVTRRAVLDWLDTEPDLLAFPRDLSARKHLRLPRAAS